MSEKALADGSLVLVTGVNGYIASHIADQLLSAGYRVRGTARDSDKIEMIKGPLLQRNSQGQFEGLVLDDLTREGAFHDALAGATGIIHVATDVSFDSDPNKVVPYVVQGMLNILQAAANTPTLKRFVYTSSSIAAVHPTPNEVFHVDSTSWNEVDARDAWAPPPYLPERAFAVYGASKVEAEKVGWEFMKAEDRHFVLNTVLPNFANGPILNPKQPGSTAGWVRGLYNRNEEYTEMMRNFPPQWAVDVRDVARLHVAALLEADVQNERLFAFAEPYNYSKIVETLKKVDPSRQDYRPPVENEGEDLSTVDTARAVELLKRMGRPGFASLEESLGAQLKSQ